MPKQRRIAPQPAPATPPAEPDFFSLELSPSVLNLYFQVTQRRVNAQNKPTPARLYHYTTAGGLLGIIESNKLRATHIDYLNDASELLYARALVEEALARHQQRAHSDNVREFLDRARRTFDVSKTMDVFVSCFCEQGDLLSQWRGYAQAGEGYSIGVDGDQFGKIGGGRNFFFGPVEYDRTAQEQIIDGVLTMLVTGLDDLADKQPAQQLALLIDEFSRVFRRAIWYPLVTFKDAMFAAENEWRAIEIMAKSETEKKVRFRSSGSKLIPYVELDFAQMEVVSPYEHSRKIPIREVFHGPTLNPDLSVRVLHLLLAKHGHTGAEVKGSRIPLRL